VKPPPFEYHAPATIDEVLELLAEGNGTQALAGGKSLAGVPPGHWSRPTRMRATRWRRQPPS
jgi:CO/xanthine dehydrogenase FAD-binding subunit